MVLFRKFLDTGNGNIELNNIFTETAHIYSANNIFVFSIMSLLKGK